MGVINITPDSFSDGGKFNSRSAFLDRFNFLKKHGVEIFDIGAESTAPFNRAIVQEEELLRFSNCLFPNLGLFSENDIISIDTYKVSTFREIYRQIKLVNSRQSIVWNDVSGVIDSELLKLLLEECPDCEYVCCHTGTKVREKSSEHMQSVIEATKQTIVDDVIVHFERATKTFSQYGILSRVTFDPAFGFSKSFEQNWELIRDIKKLLSSFSTDQKWLLGISRKSFLKKAVIQEAGEGISLDHIEAFHSTILSSWLSDLQNLNVIVRLHDPVIYKIAELAFNNLDHGPKVK